MHRYALILHIAAVNLPQWQLVLWITLSFFTFVCKSVKNEGSLRSGEQVLRVSILFTLHLTVNPRSARPLMILDYGLNSIWMLSSTKGGLLLSLSFSAWCVSLFSVWPSEIDVFTWHHKHAGCSHLLIRTVWHSQADTHTDAHDSSCTSFPVASQRCVFDHHIFQFKQRFSSRGFFLFLKEKTQCCLLILTNVKYTH